MARREAAEPFDLSRGPLLRVKLIRLRERDHLLLVTMHHIVSDAWSSGVLVREFSAIYAALAAGAEPVLTPLPIQYADYTIWQREWLRGEVLERQLRYWRAQLLQVKPLDLPLDYPRQKLESHAGAVLEFSLARELSAQLRELARRRDATLFMAMTAAFMLLLSRYAGQSDIAVGAPVAGRRWSETEELIGFFVNTLVLRTSLDGSLSFAELLRQVRNVTLDAHHHQDVPFEKLVEELEPERNLSLSPLFQTMLAFQNTPLTEMSLPGLKLARVEIEAASAKFDLQLTVDDSEQGIHGTLTYKTELFSDAAMRRFLG